MSHTDCTLLLGLEADLAVPVRGRHRSPTEIRWADPLPTDRYATGRGRCIDGTGRHRLKHEYIVWTRRGQRCIWCGRILGMEPL